MHLSTLGRIDLKGSERAGYSRILAQPKRVALLVYLATAKRGKPCRRDVVISTLWPDLDQKHARACLRQVLHGLRQELGPDVLFTRGDEEIGVSPKHVTSDVMAFRTAVQSGDLERAATLFKGPFLEGFFLREASEFDRWVESMRSTLDQEYTAVLEALAQRDAAQGDQNEAIHWWTRLAEHDPCNSKATSELVTALARSGDRVGALRWAERHMATVRSELDVEPDAAIRAAAESLRQSTVDETVPLALDAGDSEPPRPASLVTEPPVRTRRGLVAVVIVVGLMIVAAAVWRPIGVRSPLITDSLGIAVFPFAVHDMSGGGRPFDQRGFTLLLSDNLDGLGGWQVEAADRLDPARRGRSEDPSKLASTRSAAREIGVARYVTGEVVTTKQATWATAFLHDVNGQKYGEAYSRVDDPTDVLRLADELAHQLVTGLVDVRCTCDSLAIESTSSLAALEAYFEGGRLYRDGNLAAAITAFQDATRHDSTFAVGWLRLASAAAHPLDYRPDIVRRATSQIEKNIHMVPEAGRESVSGIAAVLAEDHHRGAQILRNVLTANPDNAQAWLWLGIAHQRIAWAHGEPLVEVRSMFARAAALDREAFAPRFYLAWLAMMDGDVTAADSLLGSAFPTGPWPLPLRAWSTIAHGRAPLDTVLVELGNASDYAVATTAFLVANYTDSLAAARAVANVLTSSIRSNEVKAIGNILTASIDFVEGGWPAARAGFQAAQRLDAPLALVYGGLLATSPRADTPREELQLLRDQLLRMEDKHHQPTELPFVAADRDAWGQERAYVLGRLALKIGEEAGAIERAVEIESMDGAPDVRALGIDLAAELRARVAHWNGHTARATALLQEACADVSWWRAAFGSPFFARSDLRFFRAELFAEQGLTHAAHASYQTFGQLWNHEFVYRPLLEPRQEAMRAGTDSGGR